MTSDVTDRWREGLIATKLVPSDLDPRLVLREALLASLLHAGPRAALIGIVAPAGSGKSTLMAQLHCALDAQGECTGWLSLEADDNHCASFALYFLSALSAVAPALVREEIAVIRSHPARDYDVLFDGLLRRLSQVGRPVTVFLDDFQHLTDDRVLAFLNKLLIHRPRGLRFIIGSRVRLPLDVARLRVAGELAEIGPDELNFDAGQAGEFLRRYHDLELSAPDLGTLLETTEGWPAGVQLAALALKRHRGPASQLIGRFSGRDKDLTQYLAESVLRAQPEPVQEFLLRTAPLRRMSPDLCEATSGQAGSREMLEYLERAHLFVIALDREGRWYRYHHLFGEFLQNELRRTDPEAYRTVCRRAAEWCERSGQATEAIQYALDAEHYELAADLIARKAPRVAQFDGDHFTVIDWLRRLPEPFHDRGPEILLSHAWSCAFSRDSQQALALTAQVVQELSQSHDRWGLSAARRTHFAFEAGVIRAIALAGTDQIDECLERARELRARLPEDEPFLIASICNCLGYAYFCRQEFERCAEVADEGYRYGRRSDAAYATIWADFLHGMAHVEMGRLEAAQAFGRRTLENAQEDGRANGYRNGLSSLLNMEIAIQQCDFDASRRFVDACRSFTAMFGPVEPLLVAMRNDARVRAWDGQIDGARQVLQQGQDAAFRTGQPRQHAALAIEEATLQLLAGDPAGARETARRANLWRDPERLAGTPVGGRRLREALQVLDARFQLAEGHAAAAVRSLTTLQQARGTVPGVGLSLTLRALRAVALWQGERQGEAVRELDRALGAAAAERHAYPIAAAGRGLLPVLEAIAGRRNDERVTEELLARNRLQASLMAALGAGAAPRALPEPARETVLQESLTLRETELLRLVQSGLGNRDLAGSLLVSESTVKWHLHNIYEKMGVRSRSAAVARARELKLI